MKTYWEADSYNISIFFASIVRTKDPLFFSSNTKNFHLSTTCIKKSFCYGLFLLVKGECTNYKMTSKLLSWMEFDKNTFLWYEKTGKVIIRQTKTRTVNGGRCTQIKDFRQFSHSALSRVTLLQV